MEMELREKNYAINGFPEPEDMIVEDVYCNSMRKEGNDYGNWDPLQVDYDSTQNLMLLQQDNPLSFRLGIKDVGDTSIEETPCKFYPGYGESCWKGRNCMYKHEEGQTGSLGPLDLGKEACQTVRSLDDKPRCHSNASIVVRVTHVDSPSEFYVIPMKRWECSCEEPMQSGLRAKKLEEKAKAALDPQYRNSKTMVQEEMERIKSETFRPCIEGVGDYFKVQENLNRALNTNMLWRRLQTTTYVPGELVAVKIAGPTMEIQWWRGEMLECNVKQVLERELPWFEVRLIDVGRHELIRADGLCKLPQAFCYNTGLVFKCSLNGVVPVRMKWNKSAVDFFKSHVIDKDLTLTIREPSPIEGLVKTVESVPYKVDLVVLEPNKIIRVSEEMVNAGKALPLTVFPDRRMIDNYIGPEYQYLMAPSCRQTVEPRVQHYEADRLKAISVEVNEEEMNLLLAEFKKKSFEITQKMLNLSIDSYRLTPYQEKLAGVGCSLLCSDEKEDRELTEGSQLEEWDEPKCENIVSLSGECDSDLEESTRCDLRQNQTIMRWLECGKWEAIGDPFLN